VGIESAERSGNTLSAFIDTSKVEVRDGDNVIFIKRRMDFGTKCRVEDTLTQMALVNGRTGDIRFTVGAQRLALAVHNIVGWDGPDFVDPTTKRAVPCTPEAIERLDPTYPLLVQAQLRITELNADREVPDPKSLPTAGSPSTKANGMQPVDALTST
jgi:hypothetical protein